jgi:hypothetical protein
MLNHISDAGHWDTTTITWHNKRMARDAADPKAQQQRTKALACR